VKKDLTRREKGLGGIVFSDKAAQSMASVLGIKPDQRDGFRSAYKLLPLNRAKDCIDMAYHLSLDEMDGVQSWLERYEKLAKTLLPRWARKNSENYVIRTHIALRSGNKGELREVLFEFKGFTYAVFCRALIEQYNNIKTLELKEAR
jgi:hypothetical protein